MASFIDHDQLTKSLIKAFFRQYLDLFFPDLARRLYLDSKDFPVEFLDKEHFTDIPKGRRKKVDVLAKVWTIDEVFETILIHTESQEDDRKDPDEKKMPFLDRMFCYSLLLQLRRFPEHVVPIVLWFVPNKGGIGVETYDYKAMGAGLTLTFYRVCIPDLEAEEYLRKDIPLAYALAARMKRGKLSRVRLSLACRTRIVRSAATEAEQTILLDFVSTYAKLSEKEEAEMQAILDSEPEYDDVEQSELTYYGKAQALAQARAVLTVLEARGLAVSEEARQQILRCTDARLMEAWLKRAAIAQSIDEVLRPVG